ncbi:MAG: ABC transporter substrate-binding protein, partial [Acutalibacteraceae bacterium]
MKKMKKILGIIIAASLFVLSGCSGSNGETTDPTGTAASDENTVTAVTDANGEKIVVYALNSTWSRLMPYDLNGMNMIAPNDKVFDKLTYVTEDGIGMRAAESIEMQDGGTTFVIKLREGSLWHDGEPVTSADWLWTYQTISSAEFPATASKSYLSNFTGTDDTGTVIEGETIGIEAPDD